MIPDYLAIPLAIIAWIVAWFLLASAIIWLSVK